MKDLKEKFGKAFLPPGLTSTTFSLFKELVNDELILSELLTVDQHQEIIVFIKESEKFKKLSIQSLSTPLLAKRLSNAEDEI